MDFYAFAPIAALLHLASQLINGIALLLAPISGELAMALAIIVLTVIVRTALIPVGASQVRAEFTRRRLAPELQAIQKRHKKNPEKLHRETMALYAREKSSPFAGMLPALAQAPVLSVVYGLFILATIGGQPNELLHETIFGVPLGSSLFATVAGGGAAPEIAVHVVLLALIAVTAWGSRRAIVAQQKLSTESAAPAIAGLSGILSWMPFVTVIFAAIVPLAATLYLAVTTAWTLGERALLRRRAASKEVAV